MVLINAVQSVLSIIIMISIGWVLTNIGWLDEKAQKLLSKLVVNIALPLYMVANLMGTYDRKKLLGLKDGLLIPFGAMIGCYVISIAASKLIKVPPQRQGTFRSMFALSNTIFVGLPVNIALFGEESLPFVLLYYIANTSLFWTIGVYGISQDGGKSDEKLFSGKSLKRIFSPPLTGFLVAVLLILMGVSLPRSIMDTCKYMGNLTTPLSMLFIGMVIHSVKIKDVKVNLEMGILLLGRFIIAPAIVIGICWFLPLPILMKKVFIIQAAMPAMTQTSIIAENYGADYKYAAVMTTVTTVLSLLFIPFYMLILSTR